MSYEEDPPAFYKEKILDFHQDYNLEELRSLLEDFCLPIKGTIPKLFFLSEAFFSRSKPFQATVRPVALIMRL